METSRGDAVAATWIFRGGDESRRRWTWKLGRDRRAHHRYSPLVDSSDMGPCEWARLAVDIGANYMDFDGFVVVTGTDTMAYVASALAFMLENLGKPVIVTGSQIPLCEAHVCCAERAADGSRRRRGCHVDIPRRRVAAAARRDIRSRPSRASGTTTRGETSSCP